MILFVNDLSRKIISEFAGPIFIKFMHVVGL